VNLRAGTLANLAVTIAFAIFCLGGLGYLSVSLGLEIPAFQRGWHLEGTFQGVQGLVPESDVDVAGVKVGRVLATTDDGHGHALVTMLIDSDVRLRQDVRAVVRPKSQLGEQYVELVRTPGSTAPYASDGYRLPLAQTGQAVQIDDLLNTLDPDTRAALSRSLRELGVAVDGRAGDIHQSLPEVEQTAANLRPLARTADRRQQQIDRILVDLAIIVQALADEQDALGRVIDSGDTTTAALARRDRQLAGTVQQADRLFISLDTSLAGTVPANRRSLAQAPPTIQSGRELFSTLNPEVDRILPELLLAQINYPNNQLSVSHPEAVATAYEWLSAFSQSNGQGHGFRITPVVDPNTAVRLPVTLPTGQTVPPPQLTPYGGPSSPLQGSAKAPSGDDGGGLPSVVDMLLGVQP
jgi:phospholipid/cholesterol/gamma-HCH transport system substrate-binding protein